MMIPAFRVKFMGSLFVILFLLPAGDLSAQISDQKLLSALKECETELDSSKKLIARLSTALEQTDAIFARRKAVSDSLINNLSLQLIVQDSIVARMRQNADTLHLMVQDYSKKLDEVNNLYINELKSQTHPWFLSTQGIRGFLWGTVIGGLTGLTLAVLQN